MDFSSLTKHSGIFRFFQEVVEPKASQSHSVCLGSNSQKVPFTSISLHDSQGQVHVLSDCRNQTDFLGTNLFGSSSSVHAVDQHCSIILFHTQTMFKKEDRLKMPLRHLLVLKKFPLGHFLCSDSDQ